MLISLLPFRFHFSLWFVLIKQNSLCSSPPAYSLQCKWVFEDKLATLIVPGVQFWKYLSDRTRGNICEESPFEPALKPLNWWDTHIVTGVQKEKVEATNLTESEENFQGGWRGKKAVGAWNSWVSVSLSGCGRPLASLLAQELGAQSSFWNLIFSEIRIFQSVVAVPWTWSGQDFCIIIGLFYTGVYEISWVLNSVQFCLIVSI